MPDTRSLNMTGAVLAVAFTLFYLLIIVMEKIGIPHNYSVVASGAFGLLLLLAPIFSGATTRSAKFFFADRNINSTISALSIGALMLLPIFLTASSSMYSINPGILVVLSSAICAGLALAVLLFAKPFRQSGASTLVNFLQERFESTSLSRIVAIVNLVGGLLIVTAAVKCFISLASWFFGISGTASAIIAALAIIITGTSGGPASTMRQSALAMVTFLVALNIVVLQESISVTGFPFGHVTIGTAAIQPLLELEGQLKSAGIPLLEARIENVPSVLNWAVDELALASFFIVLGIASMPLLIQQFVATPTPGSALRAGEKAIFIFGFAILSIFVFMAFEKLSLYQTVLGITADEVREEARFLFNLSSHTPPLVTVCGEVAVSAKDVITACGGEPDKIIDFKDLVFDSNFMFVASPDLTGYPFAFTAFLAISCLLLIIALASSATFSVSNNIVAAFYSARSDKVESIEIFLSRFSILLVTALTYVFSLYVQYDYSQMLVLAFGIYGACFLPGMVATALWPDIRSGSFAWSIAAGFAIAVFYWALSTFGIDLKSDTGDELRLLIPGIVDRVPAELGAAFALPVTLITLLGVQFLAPQNSVSQSQKEFDEANFKDSDDVTILRNRI